MLLAQQPEGKSNAGLWEFPGGKVEPGETQTLALTREIHKELDVIAYETDLCLIKSTLPTLSEAHGIRL